MGLCGQQGFPPSSAHTEIQCKAKSLFFAASISLCVRALWRVPWCFLEGSFQLSACWKMNWQSHLQNTPKWRNMSSYLHCWSLKRETSTGSQLQKSGRYGASGCHLTSYPGEWRDDLHSRSLRIPHTVSDIMQRFLNKLHPACSESWW